jgi:flagellar basal body P-ring protein FlgI
VNDLACVEALLDNLSIEYGVLIGIDGRGSRCLEMTESLA